MKNKLLINILIVLIFCISVLYAQGQVYDKVKINIKSNEDIQKIGQLGIPLDGCYIKKNEYIVGEFSKDDIEKIKANGFYVETLITDVSSYYEKRNNSTIDTLSYKKKDIENAFCLNDNYPTPSYFSLGSVGGYYSYNEIVAQLDSMRQRFPNLVSSKQALTPLTIEGRTIWYIKISDNPDVNENEPKVLYTGLTHAREPMGMQQLFFFAYYLLENYATNPEIKYLVDNLEIYIIPCVNPDGWALNQTTNPNGGGMHRKNCRQTGASNYGIDLNRNFGYMWGYDNTGSSPNIEAENYRGTAAFSEPETQAIKNFTEQMQFKFIIDYHCYSNVLLYPWGYTNAVTPDNSTFRNYSELMTYLNGFFYGTPIEGIGYTANGGSFDWFYGEQSTKPKIIAWSPEAGNPNDGFYPASNRIVAIAKSFMDMNMYLARFAVAYADIKDLSNRFVQTSDYIKFQLYNVGVNNPAQFTVSLVPISQGLNVLTPSKLFSNLSLFDQRIDSFQVSINPGINDGTILNYVYKIETPQGYYYTDTFSVVKGLPVTLFTENGNSITQWTSTTWNTTTNDYHSAPKSITDSPSGNYPENTTRTITLNNSISLANCFYAELTFWAKWDIEPLADYVQLQISTNNGSTWQPLCGKWTNASFLNTNMGQPIYEGQRDKWVQERIILNDYLGQNIKLRFVLKSSFSYTMQNDGFYFDDMQVDVILNPSFNEHFTLQNFQIVPNPSYGEIIIKCNKNYNGKLKIATPLGQIVKEINIIPEESSHLELKDLKGLYFLWVEYENKEFTKPQRIIFK